MIMFKRKIVQKIIWKSHLQQQEVLLREDDDGDWKTGTVVVRGGKVS